MGSGIQRVPGRYQREVAGGRREEVDQNVGEEQDDGEALAQIGEPVKDFPPCISEINQIRINALGRQSESVLPKPNYESGTPGTGDPPL